MKGFGKMYKFFAVFLALLALGLGAVAVASHKRACKAEKALAELRNSLASNPHGDSPCTNGDSPRKAAQASGDSPRKAVKKSEKNDLSYTNLPFEVTSISTDPYSKGKITILFINAGKGSIIAPKENALRISPALETTFSVSGDRVSVMGNFTPDTFYTAILSPDWRTADGRRLGREARLSIRTPKLSPEFTLLSTGHFYPVKSIGTLRFPYESRYVTNITLTIWRAFENNLNHYDRDWEGNSRMAQVAEKEVHLDPPYNETSCRMLELDGILTNQVPGVYRMRISSDSLGYRHPEVFFSLTDLGVNAAIDERDGRQAFAAVCRLSDSKPVAGAEVTFLSRKNRIAAHGVTKADGTLRVAFDPAYDSKDDQMRGVLVKTADDLSYLKLDYNSVRDENESHCKFTKPRAFIFAERDLCRPGESFDSAVFARASAKDGSRVLAGALLDLDLLDPEGTKVATRRVTTDRFGFATAKWSVPASAAMGMWQVCCTLGDNTLGTMDIRVASFIADRFRVKLETDKEAWTGLDRAVSFTGDATYYFGEKVDGASWNFKASLHHATPPRHWKGWTAGAPEEINGVKFTAKGEVRNGSFKISYPGAAAQGVKKAFAPVLIAAEASVVEAGGRAVTASRWLTAFPTDRFIGLRDSEPKDAETRAFEFSLLTATLDDVVVNETESEIALSFEKVEWDSHYVRRGDTYRTEWRETRQPQPQLARKIKLPIGAAAATWRSRIAFTAREMPAGRYILTARLGDRLKTVHDFWHWAGEVGERSSSPAALDLRADAETYAPGSVATLSFNVPYAGNAFVVAGAGTIDHSAAVPVKPGANSIRIPIPVDCVAGRYHAAVTFVTENAPKMRRLAGIASIRMDQSAVHRLTVGCKAPEQARPEGETEITVTLADRQGRPRAGRVRLAATDMGVLALTGFKTPDPYAFFFNHDFGRPFATYDLYSLIYPDLRIMPNGQIGGGADIAMVSFNRRDSNANKKETARVVLPPIDVPATGSATVKVKLPDHTGALRFMAVATDEDAVGNADVEMVLRHPATVMLSTPLFAAGGDRFTMTAQLFNHDFNDAPWKLAIELPEGMSVDGRRKLVKEGRLLKGCTDSIAFEVAVAETATEAGRICARLDMGGTMVADESFVTLHPRHPIETRVDYLVATGGVPKLQPVEADWIKAERKVERTSSPAFALRESLAWLNGYPYGCLEQTCAAAFPFLAASDLKALGYLSDAEFAMARQRIEIAYGNIMQMYLEDGGFAMWPRGEQVWDEGSLFACHFIFEAEKSGFIKLDGERRGELVDWLIDKTNRSSDAEKQAYAAYVLAVAGDEHFLNPARNACREDRPDWATLLAASALVRGGFASEGLAAMNAALNAQAWGKDGTDVRRMGMTLFLMTHSGLAEDRQALLPLVARLNARLRPDGSAWGTTQKNAWATVGLASFLNGMPLPKDAEFVRVVTTGVPKKPFPRPNPISLARRYLDADGNPTARAKKGELVTVELVLKAPRSIENAVMVDLLPAGLELEDDTFETRSKNAPGDEPQEKGFNSPTGRAELRDDRWLWFGSLEGGSKVNPGKIKYRARAVTPGRYAVPAAFVEDMYDPDMRGATEGDGMFTVE